MDEYDDHPHSWVSSATTLQGLPLATYQQVTTKIPPGYNGTTSWFTYEELVDDWCDITELDPEKRGPALRNRLEGDAAVYKPLLERDALRNAEDGVAYFKRMLRPHFVKGNQSVFMWRLFQLMKFNKGTQDFLRWIGRFQVTRKRLTDAWNDLFEPTQPEDAAFQAAFVARNQQRQANEEPLQREDEALAEHNDNRRTAHVGRFPIVTI